jgi:3-hydroxyisobutyrate dehydrogenase
MLLRKDSNGDASHTFSGATSRTQSHNVAWIGLGAMGFGMASHLVKRGFNVTGFDIYEPSLVKFRQAGGDTATSPRDAARNADFLVCMVASSAQAQKVLFDLETGAVQGMSMVRYFEP